MPPPWCMEALDLLDGADPFDRGVVFVGTHDETVGGGGAAVESPPEPNHPLSAAERRGAVEDGDTLRPRTGDLAAKRDALVTR